VRDIGKVNLDNGVSQGVFNPSGPLVGIFGTYGVVFDTFGFYYDNCYCIRSRILPFTTPTMTVKLGFSMT
jgi:hypothetical protein